MVFSSFLFLFCFLPVTLLFYAASPRALKNGVLLLASMVFYAWGAPVVLPYLLAACVFDFFVSFRLVPGRLSEGSRRLLFWIAVAGNLAALFYYKYFNFAALQFSQLLELGGLQSLRFSEVALPIGISFFTFHKISYLGDVYRGKAQPSRSLVDYCLYILFFPQLIAGPIIRYADVAVQFRGRTHSLDDIYSGALRFCIGLAKKVLIGDAVGAVADQVWSMSSTELGAGAAWLGALCYSFQIYFDFSGYSDMAIGLARVFGFRFLENFNRPYRARTFTEFWRRWHISLSNFMRDYVYIPLGGNRGSQLRTMANLWATFLLSGLWHGASWNFVFWGAFHGAFLTIDKLGWDAVASRLPRWMGIATTFFLVSIGWVFFRSANLTDAFHFLGVMFGAGPAVPAMPRAYLISDRQIAMLVAAALISFAPRLPSPAAIGEELRGRLLPAAGHAAVALSLFWLSVAALASRGYTPFLYFKF